MAGNTFGKLFRLTTFGESHGAAMGGVIDGCPAGVAIDLALVQHELDRRRPGQSVITTARTETDTVEFLSGIFEGKTLGTPIGFIIRNNDRNSADYDHLREVYRPGHADLAYWQKYGHRDHRGGGRSSARETACRVVAGAVARQVLPDNIRVWAYVSAVGDIALTSGHEAFSPAMVDTNPVRCPDAETARQMQQLIEEAKAQGDSLGGVVWCAMQGIPAGLGEPVFDKFHADLGKAMLSINAVKGFEIGSGFAGATMRGSAHNDRITSSMTTVTNHAGGMQGGITTGSDVYFRVAFKPVSTIMQEQKTVDVQGNEVQLEGKGRHDPCVVPRAVPIVEAMALLVTADHYLQQRAIAQR